MTLKFGGLNDDNKKKIRKIPANFRQTDFILSFFLSCCLPDDDKVLVETLRSF